MAEETEDEEEGIFVCGACGESFDTAEALVEHIHDQGLVD